ncbi:MAG: N-acetyltransferase [Planctomycetota bacterium]|nr:N-acetyltransferase [Planctomycetota bacterium]
MSDVRIEVARGKRAMRVFRELPYRLYKGHPVWVPPLRMAEAALMDPGKNPFFEHAEAEHFLAWRADRVVGRIAACVNHLHNETHEDEIGFFGFFDVEEGEQDAATALIEAARAWCAERGRTPMRGPCNYSSNDPCGALVDGFDRRPMLLMPYNRPDYDALLQGAGLVPVKDLLAYELKTEIPIPERFERVVNRRLQRTGTVIRDMRRDDWANEVRIVKDLYNRCWEKNWGFVPATDAEFEHAAKDLKLIVDPELSGIAERDGQPLGFSVFIKDLNEVLAGMNGRLFPFGWLKLLRGLKRIGWRRCILLGVVPEARGGAINEAFFLRAIEAAKRMGIPGAEAGWVLDDNTAMRKPIEAVGGTITKRYRMYETPS